MSVTIDTGRLKPDQPSIPWQRILFALIIPLVLLGLLFKLFSATRAGAMNPDTLHAPLLSTVLTDTLLAPNAPDLSIRKAHSGSFSPGQTITYTIIISNTGTDLVTGPITVTDNLPGGGAFTPTAMGGPNWDGCNYQITPATCVYSNTNGLAGGAILPSLTLRGTLGQVITGTITNIVTVTNPLDSNSGNNSWTDTASVVAPGRGADLAVAKGITPSPPAEGDTITYTVVLTNHGPSPAGRIILTDTLPVGLTFITSTTTTGVYTRTLGTWGINSLAAGSNATLKLVARVNVGTSGTITNTVQGVTSDQTDPDTSNNHVTLVTNLKTTRLVGVVSVQGTGVAIPSATIRMVDSANRVFTTTTTATGQYTITSTTALPIQPGSATILATKRGYRFKTATLTLVAGKDNRQDFALEPAVDLVAYKTDGRTTVSPGDTITYTVTITNFGTQVASGIVITDILPTSATYVTDTLNITHTTSGNRLVWKLPTTRELQPNGTSASVLTFRLRATIASTIASSTVVSNTIQAGATGLDGNPADNSFNDINTVSTGAANLSITKSVSPTSASPNGTLTFTIKVQNIGTLAATNVTVTDQFPTNLTITNQSTTQGQAILNSSTRTVGVNIGTMNAGATVTVTITARVNTSTTTTLTQTNYAYATYTTSGGTQSRQGAVSYQIIGTSTLPGTGFGPPIPAPLQTNPPRVGSFLSLLFLVIGLAACVTAVLLKGLRRERWMLGGIGVWMLVLAFIFSPAVKNWLRPAAAPSPPATMVAEAEAQPTQTDESLTIIWPTPEVIETLPDYPIPTPAITPTPGEDPPDSSAIQRILIPAIGLDTIVKYVPYDGYTWMIAGLRQEVAWMGDTSWPGLGSNTALAGHITLREGGSGPFRYLEELVSGDDVTLFTEKNIYKYKVREEQVVSQTDVSVVKPSEKTQLTLITCTGWDQDTRFYLERLVVTADLVDVEPRRIETRGN